MNVTETENKTETTTKKKFPLWGKVLLIVAVVLAALAGLATLYVNGKLDLLHYNDGSVDSMGSIDAEEDQDLDSTGLVHSSDEMVMPEGSPFADDNVLNILLIGTDERTEAVNDADAFTHLNQLDGTKATTEFSEDARADSLILVSLDIKDHVIRLVSIERGLAVPILLDGYEDEYDWITHTFRYGGAKLTMDTVEDCFNVQVDHYVRVNFNSFVQIVDAVGGVDIELTQAEVTYFRDGCHWNFRVGTNHLNGEQALAYARLREIDTDWTRIQRQRRVVQAAWDRVADMSVLELNNLLNEIFPMVQTNLTEADLAQLLLVAPGLRGATAEQMTIPKEHTYGSMVGMDGRSMFAVDFDLNSRALQEFIYGKTNKD